MGAFVRSWKLWIRPFAVVCQTASDEKRGKNDDSTAQSSNSFNQSHPKQTAFKETQFKKTVFKEKEFLTDKGQPWSQETISPPDEKIFNDPVHGHIRLHPLCVKIIDTPHFQRLRFLRQMGNTYLVYPGCSHNRFEHSLGVCYLAGKFARALKKGQPELNITSRDVLCVEIAGLCHDLGHGPYSHFFGEKFLPKVRPDYHNGKHEWKHEQASVDMLDFLIEKNNLWPEFEKYGLTREDLLFIKEQILGTEAKKGRPEKRFLYEIVSNQVNGIDVDKWDYLARDCLLLGMKNSFDHRRLMRFARVLEVDGRQQICFRDKQVWDLYGMFHTRYMLHLRAAQHATHRAIDAILEEALILANDYLGFVGSNGHKLKMSEAINDMEAYMKMNDYSVFFGIQHSTEPELKRSRELLEKIQKRELYKYIGKTHLKGDKLLAEGPYQRDQTEEDQIKQNILQQIPDSTTRERMEDALLVQLVTLNYGKRHQNPMDSVVFYAKEDPDTPIILTKDQVSQLLPEKVHEKQIRIYSKSKDTEKVQCLKKAFQKWCEEKNYPPPNRM